MIPRPREEHLRRFGEADKRRLLEEATRPETSAAAMVRSYGIVQHALRRWKQELTPPAFVTVQGSAASLPRCYMISCLAAIHGPWQSIMRP